MLFNAIHQNLNELEDLLQQIPEEDYAQPCPELSDVSIGEHMRHILEMYRVLLAAYDTGKVNYDHRERNLIVQVQPGFALNIISDIRVAMSKPDKALQIEQCANGETLLIQSNYYRELLYTLEHSIHHQALIKVAVRQCKNITVDANFGVARSTIEYRNKCAQ